MANLSYSVYPQDLDGYATLPLRIDGVHEIVASDRNRLRDAIVKIEQELGIQASGTFATVAARLDHIGDAHAIILAHMADTVDAHDASAISILDTADHYFEIQVEGALEELSTLLPPPPDEMGEDNSKVPNDGIPSFFDGYGTKFVFNTSSSDGIHKRTQPSSVDPGVRGVHIVEVGDGVDNGDGYLRMTGGIGSEVLEWMAPGDSTFGVQVSIAPNDVDIGETITLESSDTTKRIKVTRSGVLGITAGSDLSEHFDIYSAEFVSGYFSIPSEGFQSTEHITRTAVDKDGDSRLQCMIGGTVFPADRGTLVLQRKTRGVEGATGFWPVAVLDLGTNFDDTTRTTGQPVYTPSMTLFDTVTLYDRYPIKGDYTIVTANADGLPPYDNFENDFTRMQIAKYVIPISNSEIVGGTLTSPENTTQAEIDDNVSGYRIFHYKEGVTDFGGDPTSSEVYGIYDSSHPTDRHDANNPVRFSNVFVDTSSSRPGVELLNIRPKTDGNFNDKNTHVPKYVSGVRYYDSEDELTDPAHLSGRHQFDFELRSDNNVFNKTYVVENILTFETDVFDFPSGTEDGKWGAQVDVQELVDDGYIKFSNSNLPDHEDQAFYIVNDFTSINGVATHEVRRLVIAPDRFSNHAWIRATLYDPFGPGDGYDAYGAESIHRILVNSYSTTRATDTIEYFTDESRRINDSMEFDTGVDGYNLSGFESEDPLPTISLQAGGRFTDDEFNIPGLIYPQTDYYTASGRFRPDPTVNASMDYTAHDGYHQYQRLFGLGYPINNGQLRIVSGGNSPISFEDIRQGNIDRFGKIEIKIPGHGTNSTEWLDLGRLFSTGNYEDGYGALHGGVTGSSGDFTVPFTFGPRSTADDHGTGYIDHAVAVRVTYFGETGTQRQISKQKIMTMIQLLP